MIDEYKIEILNKTNILLISTEDRTYEELKKYGFKNINQFKSILSIKTFLEKKHKFERYHMVIIDSKMYDLFKTEPFLEELRTIAKENKIFRIVLEIDRDFSHINLFSAHFKSNGSMKDYLMCGNSYQDIFEKIVVEAGKNGIIGNLVPKRIFTSARITTSHRLKKCPRTKIRLKILCLLPYEISDKEYNVAENLAIKVDFKEVKKYEFEKNIINYLGNYDMILANESISKKLIKLNEEANEQCKIVGRKLAVLINFEDIKESKEDIFNIEYSYAGIYAPNSYSIKETCKILDPKLKEDQEKYYKTKLKCIFEEAFFIYNAALIKSNDKPVKNFSVRKSGRTKKIYRVEKRNVLPENKYFKELSNIVYEYLNLKKTGILIDDTKGLKIKTKGDVITVFNAYDEGIVCGLSFDQNGILSFMNKDRNDKLDVLDSNTNVEFNELELEIIFSIYKKVVLFLKPLIKVNEMII